MKIPNNDHNWRAGHAEVQNKFWGLSWAKEEGYPGSHLRQLSFKFLKVHEALRLAFIFREFLKYFCSSNAVTYLKEPRNCLLQKLPHIPISVNVS